MMHHCSWVLLHRPAAPVLRGRQRFKSAISRKENVSFTVKQIPRTVSATSGDAVLQKASSSTCLPTDSGLFPDTRGTSLLITASLLGPAQRHAAGVGNGAQTAAEQLVRVNSPVMRTQNTFSLLPLQTPRDPQDASQWLHLARPCFHSNREESEPRRRQVTRDREHFRENLQNKSTRRTATA
ncbi:hypothetical protein VZT92_019665 [Zoarces viviparus]|uniref:Uncharacterized protein n=1 Tax=Zoarces viviparus TaxID=48416 RepID=A0AAW1ELN1_ZOAVI